MVLNKRDLERAFSPNKHRKSLGQRRILNKSNNGRDASNQFSSSMRVVVRIRPQNAKELEKSARSVIRVADENMLIFDPKEEAEPFFFHGSRQNCRDIQKRQNKDLDFAFDRVFDPNSPNEAVFEGSTKDIVKSLLDGYNCSVFAYGATGAGKTYTMLGSKTSPGITYLTIVELYRQIETLINEREFDLAVSHLEVYNENVQDLIQPSGPLHVREDGMSGVQIPGLSVHRITNADDLFALMAQGNKNRTQHPTDANAESSRSHSVFQLYVRMTNKLDRSIKMVKLSMIDLAGSERASATGCQGMRFTEGANINRSLLALGNCINCLADGRKHIPYRDSKLTRLLKDSLGGNCQTVMIANVSLSSSSYEDTYNTLKYATRAKKIKQMVKKNIVTVQLNASQYSKVVASLTEENEKLKQRLKMYEAEAEKGAIAPVVPPEVLPSFKDQLLLPYKELETMNREISKLVKEIKLLKWRNVVKQKIADRLPCLSIDTFQMRKRLDRLRTSMRQLEGREISFKQKLRETCMKRNECLKNTNCLVKKLDENGTNIQLQQHVVNLHLQLELQERNLQLEHCQQLLSMQQNELESEDMVLKQICSFLKEYHFLLHGHNLTTEAMMSNYEELVRRLEGFKHISWKNDQETDDICNFTFSVAEFSRQNLCSEVITNTEISNKASTGKAIPQPVGDCGEGNSCSNGVSTVTFKVHELSEVCDIKQCGNGFFGMMFEGGTLKVTSGNGTVAGPDSNIGVTDMCMMLKTASEDDNVPRSQTSLPENTELSEAEGTKDKTAECCGILKETNLVVGCVQNIAPHFVMPVEVGCDVTVSNSCSIVDASLNNTFVLPSGPSSHFQNKGPRSFSDGSNSQHKIQNTADNSACSKKRRGHNEHSGKLCNKENRATAMELIPQASTVSKSPMYRLTPHSRHYQDPVTLGGAAMKLKSSASYQRGGYNSNKCQLYTPAGSVMYGLTPRSKHYQDHVSMKALGRKTYLNQRRQLSRGYPYVN